MYIEDVSILRVREDGPVPPKVLSASWVFVFGKCCSEELGLFSWTRWRFLDSANEKWSNL